MSIEDIHQGGMRKSITLVNSVHTGELDGQSKRGGYPHQHLLKSLSLFPMAEILVTANAVASIASIIDISARLIINITRVVRITQHLGDELSSLEAKIKNFGTIYEVLNVVAAARQQHEITVPAEIKESRITLLAQAKNLIEKGVDEVENLAETLEDILGKNTSATFIRFEAMCRALRLSSKTKRFREAEARFTSINQELTIALLSASLKSASDPLHI